MDINIFKEIVNYTASLDIQGVRVYGTDTKTTMEGLRQTQDGPGVVMNAEFLAPVSEFIGSFGIQNLGKLNVILNIPEYKENAKLELIKKDDKTTFLEIRFVNEAGDFRNNFRLTNLQNVKTMESTGLEPEWLTPIVPSEHSIQRLKYLSQAVSEDPVVEIFSDKSNLKMKIGDVNNSQGDFVFYTGMPDKVNSGQCWSVKDVLAALTLTGDKEMYLSNDDMLKIVVNSGVAVYTYQFPGLVK